MVDHIDGDESHGARSNLRYLCRSCNVKHGAKNAAGGRGRRTAQFNPEGGAKSYAQWAAAVASIDSTRPGSRSGAVMDPADAAAIIDATPAADRAFYQSQVWADRKRLYGKSGRQYSIPF
jgi:hypothetical protein